MVRKELLINGVYKILNIQNGKFYIGSSSSKYYIYNRLKNHQKELTNNCHPNKHLQNAFNKYGIENFYYDIIEICDRELCLEREQYWINTLNPQYNIVKVAGSTLGRTCSEETKLKISESNKRFYQTEEGVIFKEKLSKSKLGIKTGRQHSEEFKKKMSLIHKNRVFSEETKQKMKKPKLSLRKKIYNLIDGKEFLGHKEVSDEYGISMGYVCALINNRRTSKKYKLVYEEILGV